MDSDEKAKRRASQRQSRSIREPRRIGDILGDRLNQYSFPAIPTTYGGIQFRSRLEATWAAFFDLCDWKWGFEPVDADGWIPDFRLGPKPTLVEIKPFFHLHEWQAVGEKIHQATDASLVALLGADPVFINATDSGGAVQLGWLYQKEDPGWTIWNLHFGFIEGYGYSDAVLGLCAMDGPWWNITWESPPEFRKEKCGRVWGKSDRGRDATEVLVEYWNAAKNITKWRPS